MKALLIFLFVSLTAGDKLNPAYLPPPGANYSGGAGDNEVPFEVPAGNFGLKDESATRLTPGIFREGGVTSYRPSGGTITSSTYAPISDGRITSPDDGRIIPSTYASTADGRIVPSTYAPTTNERFISSTYSPIIPDGKIIPSTLVSTSDSRIIPSNYSPTSNGRLPTSTYAADSDGKITSTIYKPTSDGRIISSTYAPTTYPSTTSNYNSYSTTLGPYRQSFDQGTDGLSNRPNEENYSPNQYSKDVNTKLPVSSENQFENDDYDTRRPVSFGLPSTTNNNGGEKTFINNKEIGAARYPERKARPQEQAERNAVILNNENIITPDGYFAYSFDTSNDIHADESGTASDGVKANGSYSYIGDDGILYNVTYSADEYGFQPRGDHLPTPPPVPVAILKVIEQAAKDRDNGIFDDGSYDERKYGFKKYEPIRDRILGDSGPQQEPSSKPNKISQGKTSSKTDGVTLPNSQENGYYNVNRKGTDIIKPNESTNRSPYEAARDYNDESNQDSQGPGFPNNVRIPGNRIYNYSDPRDKNFDTPSTNNDQKNRNYYDANRLSGPKGSIVTNNQNQNQNEPLKNTFIETQNGYSYPNPNRQFGERIPNQTSRFDQNKNNLGFPQKTNQFATGRPTEYNTPTTEKAKDFGANTDRVKDYTNSPTSTGRVRDFSTFTDRPRDYYSPSTTEKFNRLDTYTDRPRDYYSPSTDGVTSTERIRPTGPFTRPSNYSNRPATTSIQQFDSYTDRSENNFYNPTSTGSVNEFGTYTNGPDDYNTGVIREYDTATGRPTTYYGPTSTNTEFGTSAGRPKDVYSSSTQGTIDFDQSSGRPNNNYNSLPTQRKDFVTDRPNDYYYSPTSTERRKEFDTVTDRPDYYYGPLSTERVRPTGSFTRPGDYYTPTSTIGINEIGTYTVRPTNYRYRPTSTERINEVNTITGKPSDYSGPGGSLDQPSDYYNGPNSTKQTVTGRPTDYYSPSSTDRIKAFDTATGRPVEYYVPSSTDRIKAFDTATGRPNEYYGPSSTERIKTFDTATGRPIDFNGPSSMQSVKDFARPNEYYGPSSTERIKDFGTATGRPTEYYGPFSTERITGEDFSGPKQPQRYDPETGYHY